MGRKDGKSRVFDSFLLSNLPVIISLILLGTAPLFILQNELYIANQLAGYAFYLLIIGVIWKAIQYIIGKHPPENSTAKKMEPPI